MPKANLPIKFDTGLHPERLGAELESINSLILTNKSPLAFAEIKLTVSYFDEQGQYLDFEDFDIEDIPGHTHRLTELSLKMPEGTCRGTLDIEGVEQNFLRRHWGKLSTFVIIIWGLIVLSRRLAPDF